MNDIVARLRDWRGDPDEVMQNAADEIESLHRTIEVLVHERDRARARYNHTTKLLVGIHSLLYPAPITTTDGRTMMFRPKNPHDYLQTLSDRIRALPEELLK